MPLCCYQVKRQEVAVTQQRDTSGKGFGILSGRSEVFGHAFEPFIFGWGGPIGPKGLRELDYLAIPEPHMVACLATVSAGDAAASGCPCAPWPCFGCCFCDIDVAAG